MGGSLLPVCVWMLPMTGKVSEDDLQRTTECLFDGITIQPDDRPDVRRAREQIAAGERLGRIMGMVRNDAVDVAGYLHPDEQCAWVTLGRFEQLVVDVVRFCKSRGFSLSEVAK